MFHLVSPQLYLDIFIVQSLVRCNIFDHFQNIHHQTALRKLNKSIWKSLIRAIYEVAWKENQILLYHSILLFSISLNTTVGDLNLISELLKILFRSQTIFWAINAKRFVVFVERILVVEDNRVQEESIYTAIRRFWYGGVQCEEGAILKTIPCPHLCCQLMLWPF